MKKKIEDLKSVFSQDNPKIKKQIDRVKEKGHQRMTVLVIPHGYDSSFHFQISVFTIIFFAGLLVSLLTIAIFAVVRSSNTQSQINQLSEIYGNYFDTYLVHSNQYEEMKEDYSKLNENLLELFSLIDGQDDELLKIPSEDLIQASAFELLQKEEKEDRQLDVGRKYLNEIYDNYYKIINNCYKIEYLKDK